MGPDYYCIFHRNRCLPKQQGKKKSAWRQYTPENRLTKCVSDGPLNREKGIQRCFFRPRRKIPPPNACHLPRKRLRRAKPKLRQAAYIIFIYGFRCGCCCRKPQLRPENCASEKKEKLPTCALGDTTTTTMTLPVYNCFIFVYSIYTCMHRTHLVMKATYTRRRKKTYVWSFLPLFYCRR